MQYTMWTRGYGRKPFDIAKDLEKACNIRVISIAAHSDGMLEIKCEDVPLFTEARLGALSCILSGIELADDDE